MQSPAARLRWAIRTAKTEAELDAAGAELYAAGKRGAITAQEYADLKALGGRCRAELRQEAAEHAAPGEVTRAVLEALRLAATADDARGVYRAAAARPALFTTGEEQLIAEAYKRRLAELGAEEG